MLASTADVQGPWCAGKQHHPPQELQPKGGICALGVQVTHQHFLHFRSSFIHGLIPVVKSQTGWRGSSLLCKAPISGFSPSTGHPVPEPELTHLLEHGQELWTVKRGLSWSSCPGRSQRWVPAAFRVPLPLNCMKLFVTSWGSGCFSHIKVECTSADEL